MKQLCLLPFLPMLFGAASPAPMATPSPAPTPDKAAVLLQQQQQAHAQLAEELVQVQAQEQAIKDQIKIVEAHIEALRATQGK